jgi:hypothetical protein
MTMNEWRSLNDVLDCGLSLERTTTVLDDRMEEEKKSKMPIDFAALSF